MIIKNGRFLRTFFYTLFLLRYLSCFFSLLGKKSEQKNSPCGPLPTQPLAQYSFLVNDEVAVFSGFDGYFTFEWRWWITWCSFHSWIASIEPSAYPAPSYHICYCVPIRCFKIAVSLPTPRKLIAFRIGDAKTTSIFSSDLHMTNVDILTISPTPLGILKWYRVIHNFLKWK